MMTKFNIGDKVVITSLLNPDEPLTIGKTYEVVKHSINCVDFFVIGDDGEEIDVSPSEVEHVSRFEPLQVDADDDKPFRDALSEIGKRIREHEQKIEQLKAIGEAIKKLREEG